MANWVKCEAYTEEKDTIWVNLDLVAKIRPFSHGSVLTFAVPKEDHPMELTVWDKAHELVQRNA